MKEDLQDEINDVISHYDYYIGIRPHFDCPTFFKVFHKDCSRKNHQKNIIAYDRDGSVDCRHRTDVEGERAIRGDRSYYLFHYEDEMWSTCSRSDPSQNLPENALRRLYKYMSVPIERATIGKNKPNRTYSSHLDRLYSAYRRQMRMAVVQISFLHKLSTMDKIPSAKQKYTEIPHSIKTIRP